MPVGAAPLYRSGDGRHDVTIICKAVYIYLREEVILRNATEVQAAVHLAYRQLRVQQAGEQEVPDLKRGDKIV